MRYWDHCKWRAGRLQCIPLNVNVLEAYKQLKLSSQNAKLVAVMQQYPRLTLIILSRTIIVINSIHTIRWHRLAHVERVGTTFSKCRSTYRPMLIHRWLFMSCQPQLLLSHLLHYCHRLAPLRWTKITQRNIEKCFGEAVDIVSTCLRCIQFTV
jgi:hypothetical protein